ARSGARVAPSAAFGGTSPINGGGSGVEDFIRGQACTCGAGGRRSVTFRRSAVTPDNKKAYARGRAAFPQPLPGSSATGGFVAQAFPRHALRILPRRAGEVSPKATEGARGVRRLEAIAHLADAR